MENKYDALIRVHWGLKAVAMEDTPEAQKAKDYHPGSQPDFITIDSDYEEEH